MTAPGPPCRFYGPAMVPSARRKAGGTLDWHISRREGANLRTYLAKLEHIAGQIVAGNSALFFRCARPAATTGRDRARPDQRCLSARAAHRRATPPIRTVRRSPKGVPMPLFNTRATESWRSGSAQAPEPPKP